MTVWRLVSALRDARLPIFACLLLATFGVAAPIFQITDLGVLSGGSYSGGSALSSNGLVSGSADTEDFRQVAVLGSATQPLSEMGPAGASFSYGTGVNAVGSVAGYGLDDAFSFRAFVAGSSVVVIPTLGGGSNYAFGINDAGQVVGSSETASFSEHAYTYQSGTVTDLHPLIGGDRSIANAVNQSGQIAGEFESAGDTKAFLISGGTSTDLGVLDGFYSSRALGLNDGGEVVGVLADEFGNQSAFLWNAGSGMTELAVLSGASGASARGINNSGWIVGSNMVGFDELAVVLINGVPYDLNTLLDLTGAGWTLFEATAVNDTGQIVGSGYFQGELRAFLLTPMADETPIPEPGSWLLVLSGCGALALAGRRRSPHTKRTIRN